MDGSVVYERQGAGYKYFQGIVPRLREQRNVQLEVMPSPTGLLDNLTGNSAKRHSGHGGRRFWDRVQRKSSALFWRWKAAASGPAVFHSYFYTRSPARRWPELQVIHDLISEIFEADHQTPFDHEFRARKRACIERASRLIAVSENTKQDLCRVYGLNPALVTVVPQAIQASYFQFEAPAAERLATRTKYGIDRPYFLQVGGRMRHKNFARLLEAFASSRLASELLLVCAGEIISAEESALIVKWGLQNAIRPVRWPSEEELRNLFRDAKGLVYPSLYEGFGIPPLEAMASGIPVAASKLSSVPEVCGEAALYFDPLDPGAMAKAMASLLDEKTAQALVACGNERVALFSWERAAKETAAIYRQLAS